MSVSGVVKTIVSPFSGPKERMPWIIMRSIFDMAAVVTTTCTGGVVTNDLHTRYGGAS